MKIEFNDGEVKNFVDVYNNGFATGLKQGEEKGEEHGFEKGVIATMIFLGEHFEKNNTKWGKKAAVDCDKLLDIYLELEKKNEND